MTILFLVYPAFTKSKKNTVPWYDYLFSLGSFLACGYVFVNYVPILSGSAFLTGRTSLYLSF